MNRQRILLLLMVIALLVISCSIPSVQLDGAQATSIAKTVEAVSRGEVGTPHPNNAPGIRPAGAGDGQSQRPTPTTIPTKSAPTAGANSAPQSQSLSLDNLNFFPSNTVYYGNCSAGEETSLHVETAVSPLDQVKEVLLWFDISDPTGIAYTGSVSMWQLGIGDYAGDIDIGQIALNAMVDRDGSVTFWVEVVDKNNASIHSNAYSASIWYCGGGVLGPPPEDVALLSFKGPMSANAGDMIMLEWEVLNACKVFLNGDEVATHVGSYDYAIPSHWGGQDYRFTLTAWGNSCDNSSEVSANHDMWVETIQTTVSKGSGDLYDSYSLDFGDGNGDDIIFDHRSDGTVLYTVWGSELKSYGNWEPSSVAECVSELNASSFTVFHINVDQFICYKTGSGNYGYLEIKGLFLDLGDRTNSYVGVSYYTELAP